MVNESGKNRSPSEAGADRQACPPESEDRLDILLLADSLPNPQDPDPHYHYKNIYALRPMSAVAGRQRVTWPLLVPRLPGLVRLYYRLRGKEVHFPAPLQGRVGQIDVHPLRYVYLPGRYTRNKTGALRGFTERCEIKFSLIHCHTVYDLGLCGLALRRQHGIPLVVSTYGTDVNWLFEKEDRRASPRIAEATAEVLRQADAVTCVSRDLAGKVESLGVAPENIHWVPNGIDTTAFFPEDKSTVRGELGWPEHRQIVLFVGNVIETKGVGDLLEAARLLTARERRGEAPLFHIAGLGGSFEARLKEKTASCGIEDEFRFLGPCPFDRVHKLIKAADLVCLPSWREGWPLVLMEAMACGRPSVATRVGGIPEIIDDESLGLLCDKQDPAGLAETISAALEESWDTELISSRAERFSYSRIASRIEEIYMKVTEGEHSAP